MDPITHTLTGAALSRAGLHRATPLATATLVIAANAPDIDILAYYRGAFAPLALRRGLTHGPVALLLLPVLITAGMLLYDRYVRRRRRAQAMPVQPAAVFGLALLGTLTHPALDWMNTYGIRLLMPFSDRWFYGDALFIIDPWIWLMLAAPLALFARRAFVWLALGAATTALVLVAPVPGAARVVWLAGVAALALGALHVRRSGDAHAATVRERRVARGAVAAAALYIVIMVAAGRLARGHIADAARVAGLDVRSARDIMFAPRPANPFGGEIVVVSDGAYHMGGFTWLERPHVTFAGEPIPFGPRAGPVAVALEVEDVQHYLTWSRYPFITVSRDGDATIVRFRDARYATGAGLDGPVVRVTADAIRAMRTLRTRLHNSRMAGLEMETPAETRD